MTRRIKWEKWTDPLKPLVDRWAAFNEDGIEAPEVQTDDDFGDDYDPLAIPHHSHGVGPAVIGPNGIIPLRESNLPSRMFNFWSGHTNFTLDATFASRVEKIDGVETLDIFTRYRFRVGVGRLFDEKVVMAAIEASCKEEQDASRIRPSLKFGSPGELRKARNATQ